MLEAQTKLNITRIESPEELELLIVGDIIEVDGRTHYVMVHYNDKSQGILNLFGRGGGESVQWIIAQYPNISVDGGKISIRNPDIDTFWSERKKDSINNGEIYRFSRERLREAEIW